MMPYRSPPSTPPALPFQDRRAAGRALANYLLNRPLEAPNPLVLALPRGGVPVGFEVAQALHAPLDVLVVRKLGVPGHDELAMGAIATGGLRVLNHSVIDTLHIPPQIIDEVASQQGRRLHQLEALYRGYRPPPPMAGHSVLLVDDGLATGSTMQAAADAVRQHGPARVIVAVPVASVEACDLLAGHADEVVCLAKPEPFQAVGLWYEDFAQTSDEEVRELLEHAHQAEPAHS